MKAVKAHKITGDPLNGTAKTSNLWRELEKYNISSGRGSARQENKETFKRLANVARLSQLRGVDAQRYYELLLTDAIFINKLAPFAWASDGSLRLMLKDLHEYYLDSFVGGVECDASALTIHCV